MAIEFHKAWAGQRAKCIRSGAQLQTNPTVTGSGMAYFVNVGDTIELTGWYYYLRNTYYIQTTDMLYLLMREGESPYFNLTDAMPSRTLAQAQNQAAIIIEANKFIFENNLILARFSSKLTLQERQQVVALQKRLAERNSALKNREIIGSASESTPPGYIEYLPYLDNLVSSIGFVITTTTIIVSVVILASVSTAAYYALKYYAKQAVEDVKFSKKLTQTLVSKLSKEEYDALMKETKGLVSKAVILNRLKAGGNFTLIVGLMVGGYLLANFIANHVNKKRNG